MLAVLILTQVFHLLSPGRTSYLRRLLVSVVGVTIAEWAGSHLLPAGPRLGDLHPGWDLVFTAPLQLVVNRVAGRR